MSTAFVGAHLFTGDGRDFDKGSVKVEKGRITEVRTDGSSISADVTVDLQGRSLLPGFIDLHDHITSGDCERGYGDEAKSFKMEQSIVEAVLDSVEAARKTLQAGITSARDTAARDYLDVRMKRAQARGQIEGPRIVASGPGVCMTGGHGAFLDAGHEADGVTAVIRRVRELVANKVDVVKTISSDGPETGGEWDSAQFTKDEVAAAFAEAKRLGRRTAAHAMGHEGVNNVVTSGVETLEHGWYISEENCANMLKQGTYLIPTLGNVVDIIHKGPGLEMPWAVLMAADEQAIFDRHAMAVQMGVKIGMGSDCGGNEARVHGDNLLELDCYVRCGMKPISALTSAALEAAKAIRIDEHVGSIEVGKMADFVILDGDPLADIRLTQTGVVGVVQGGAVKRDDLGVMDAMRRDSDSWQDEIVVLAKQGALG